MTTCCGQPRSTKFCPDCGKKLWDDPILELLAHCRRTEQQTLKMADTVSRVEHQASRDRAPAIRRKAAKWKAWGDALASLLEGREGAP